MKFTKSLCFLLATSGVVSAAPAADINSAYDVVPSTDVEVRSLNEANHALATLEQRETAIPATCKKIGRVILAIGTSTAINALINEAGNLAKDICADEGAPNCVRYIGYIQRGINLAFIAIGFAHGSIGESNTNEQQSILPGNARRDTTFNFADSLTSAMKDSGYGYDSVEHIDIPGLKIAKRDSEPTLQYRSIVRNMTHDDGSAHDIAFNYYDNGDLNLHLAGDFQSLHTGEDPALTQTTLQKRFDGAGFKISLTTRKRSLLTRAHQNEMSNRIAADWAVASYRDHAADYIGLVKTDHTANFYFRIIPEIRGFGLNYESVNICGQLAPFL